MKSAKSVRLHNATAAERRFIRNAWEGVNVRPQPMWCALTTRGRITATWYRGCVQPFRKWRAAVINLGYTPVRCTVQS